MSHRVVMLATVSLVVACSSHGPVSPHLRDPGLDVTLDKQEASSGDSVGFSITFSFSDAPGDPVYLHISFDAKPTAWDTLTVPPSQRPLTGVFVVPANLPAGTLTVTVFIACVSDFMEQPVVADGASAMLVQLFGDAGRHSRSAIGVAALPRGAPVEIEVTVALREER